MSDIKAHIEYVDLFIHNAIDNEEIKTREELADYIIERIDEEARGLRSVLLDEYKDADRFLERLGLL